MISRWTRARAVIWVALTAFAAAAAPAQATDFIVNTTADAPATPEGCTPAPGGCTLREAILDATPVDRVLVPTGTYALNEGPLAPMGDTIVGAGARTTVIDGGGTGNVFHVITAGNQISGLTITNGGGASQSSSVGGGILVSTESASLTLTDSTVRGNNALAGGGIANLEGTLTVVGSTVAGNVAASAQSAPLGGGIAISGGTTTLRNTTVSGNLVNSTAPSAQGGGIYVEGSATLVTQNVTIAGNQAPVGGGLYRAARTSATVSHTIVAGNLGGACAGDLAQLTADHNIADDASCGFGGTPADALLGLLANNGGPTDTHALPATSPAVNAGTICPPTDQRGAARVGACDIGAFEFVPPPPPPPPPPPGPPLPSPQVLPPPVAGKSVNALRKRGTVKVKLPRTRRFRVLAQGQQIPVGTIVDTRKGRVTLVAAANKKGGTATSDFYGGIFKLSQTKRAKPITTLRLVEKLSCKKSGKASAAAKKKRKKRRKLWGDGKGRFRTRGSYSSATVRGTRWLVQDRCTSTLTRVKRGRVTVRDFVKHKTVIVRAGKRYRARRK